MEKKEMYALTYLYAGNGDDYPTASTLAVSTDVDKLRMEMRKCIEQDCEIPTLDEAEGDEDTLDELCWEKDRNYSVYRDYGDLVELEHNMDSDVWTRYEIRIVELL